MSSAVRLENSSSPSYVGEAPHTENQLVAMCLIYSLLNQAMGEGVKVQGDVAMSLSTGQDKITETLKTLNTNMSALKEQIQKLQDNLDTLSPYLTAFSIATIALGVVGAAVGPVLASLGYVSTEAVSTVVTIAAKVLNGLVGIVSGVIGMVEGGTKLQQAGCTHDLAPVNADASLATAAQKNYQSTSKMVVAQIGEAMSSMTRLAQSIAKDIRTINEGLREANRNVLQGVLGNYK